MYGTTVLHRSRETHFNYVTCPYIDKFIFVMRTRRASLSFRRDCCDKSVLAVKIIEMKKNAAMIFGIQSDRCRGMNFPFNDSVFRSEKKQKKLSLPLSPNVKRLFQIGTYVSVQFSFSPGTFQFSSALFSFYSSGYILELTISSGAAATLDFVQRSRRPQGLKKAARNVVERREYFSTLENVGRSSEVRLGKLINLFIRRINIVIVLRLAQRPHGSHFPTCLIGRPLADGDFDRETPSLAWGAAYKLMNVQHHDIPSFTLALPMLHYSGREYKQIRSCRGKGNPHYALIARWDSDLENRFSWLLDIENADPCLWMGKYCFLSCVTFLILFVWDWDDKWNLFFIFSDVVNRAKIKVLHEEQRRVCSWKNQNSFHYLY